RCDSHPLHLSLHDALPIYNPASHFNYFISSVGDEVTSLIILAVEDQRLVTSSPTWLDRSNGGHLNRACISRPNHLVHLHLKPYRDRKSTRLNSSHVSISYA